MFVPFYQRLNAYLSIYLSIYLFLQTLTVHATTAERCDEAKIPESTVSNFLQMALFCSLELKPLPDKMTSLPLIVGILQKLGVSCGSATVLQCQESAVEPINSFIRIVPSSLIRICFILS